MTRTMFATVGVVSILALAIARTALALPDPPVVDASAPTTVSGSGGNTASNSVGTAQVGGGNTATGSAGSVQVSPVATAPAASVQVGRTTVRVTAPAGISGTGGNSARNSVGSVQVGGGNSANRSIGSVQASGVHAAPSVAVQHGSRTAVHAGAAVGVAGSGNSADRSIGTAQVGGGNNATRSAGTAQSGPVTGVVTGGVLTPFGNLTLAELPMGFGGTGGNDATGSIGTFQLGGGNTASNSAGTAQVGGGNTAGGSIGTAQVGGGSSATGSAGTPANGTAAGAAGPAGSAANAAGTPAGTRTRGTLAERHTTVRHQSGSHVPALLRRTATLLTLPFTGLPLGIWMLLAAAVALLGFGVRARVPARR